LQKDEVPTARRIFQARSVESFRLPKCVSSLFCRNAAVADIVDPPLLTHSGLTVRPRSNVLLTLDFWNAAPAHQLQPDRMGSNSPIVAAAPDRLAIGRLAMPERPVPGPLIAAVRCHIRSLHSLAELPAAGNSPLGSEGTFRGVCSKRGKTGGDQPLAQRCWMSFGRYGISRWSGTWSRDPR
jgi:hypothetical protein